jgi:hypothetical protein
MGTSANAERRASTRRRFNGTVELALPDETETYEADAIDLSIGGISLKTAFLPDVGSELDCRFVLDGDDPRTVHARGQVVWAKDHGNVAGAFGLCFTDLSKSDRAAIEKRCAPKNEKQSKAGPTAVDPHANNAVVNAETADERVRLRLSKMNEPLKAKVRQQVDDAVVVAMDLSFITLGDHVEVESSTGKSKGILEDVRVDVDASSQCARLVLTISLDAGAAHDRSARHAALIMPSKPTAVAPREARTIAAKPSNNDAAVIASAHDEDKLHPAPSIQGTGTEVLSSKESAARADAAANTTDESSDEQSALASQSSTPAWLVSAMMRFRVTSRSAWDKAAPAIKRAFAALVAFAMSFTAKIRATVTGKPMSLPSAAKGQRETNAKSTPGANKPILRKQKPAAELVEDASAIDSTAPSIRRKYAMMGLAAFGLSAIVFALATSERERRPQPPRPQVAVTSASTDPPTNSTSPMASTSDTPVTNTATSTSTPTGERENNGTVESAPASEPSLALRSRSAMPSDLVAAARSRNANVDSEHPTVRREASVPTWARSARSMAASNAPAPMAANVTVRPLGSPAVRTGTVLRLRLDGPITNLTGGASGADSLTFRVQGRRALDRAAAFVRMDPRIAGAGAYNRGGNMELTLRFHGSAPPFYARARGDVLEVTLAAPVATANTARGAARPAAHSSTPGVRIASMPRR